MANHRLKILSAYLDEIASGRKTFELRKDDRAFRVGDTLTLVEIDGAGRKITVTVVYKLERFAGLLPGFCILGITLGLDADQAAEMLFTRNIDVDDLRRAAARGIALQALQASLTKQVTVRE